MTDKQTHLQPPGTLVRPGPIGRLVRLVLGSLCLGLVWRLLVYSGVENLASLPYWLCVLLGLALIPDVVNIGLGVNWGKWPRWISTGFLLLAVTAAAQLPGSFPQFWLWAAATTWLVYLYSHLGISFVLSAALATPGCEMRALAHLAGRLSGKPAQEHTCPAFIQAVDNWESRRHGAEDDPHPRDLMGNPGGLLLFYGIPFVALQVAGNLADHTIATAVPALAFLFAGISCLINAARSGRIHCYFTGPWCLVAGVATGLYGLGVIDFGPHSWSLIVNTGLAGAAIAFFLPERFLGRYRATPATSAPAPRPSVKLLIFDGCPLADRARATLESALNVLELGRNAYETFDLLAAKTPAELVGWGSPTILINGQDICGQSKGDGVGCRLYEFADGVPDRATMIYAIEQGMGQ